MLKSLHIRNFALIDDIEMTFHEGLSAMTGETGAGKSIILESLQLLFGKRADAQMIRHGETRAHVHGVFHVSKEVSSLFDVPEVIEVEREIDQNGRHYMRLNGNHETLSRIKDLMLHIGSIHSQNETMNLFERSYYLTLIDQVNQAKIDTYLNKYLMDRSTYLEKKKHYQSLKDKKNQSIEKKSFLEFQVQELAALSLKPNEKVLLDEQVEKLKHHDKIMRELQTAYQSLESEQFSIDHIFEASKALDKIKTFDPNFQNLSERLASAYYELDDVKSLIYEELDGFDFNQQSFDDMQERSYELSRIEQKYQKTVDELIAYLKDIQDELLMITDYDSYLKQAEKTLELAFEQAYASGLILTKEREKLALKLEKDVLNELKDLDLEKASFKIQFEPKEKSESSLLETGLDEVDFMISLNEGEPIKPLSKVASGGERARFMFALKSIYATSNQLSLLILDEIDIGISGKTAAKVAEKMKMLSETMQLIVITHLPQVASRADHQYQIIKTKEGTRMVTRILELDFDMRVEVIALMLSDEKLSHFAIEQAKMLLHK